MARQIKQINVQIGMRLREARENMGISQEKFAELFGIEPIQYQRLENGIHQVTLDKMLLLYEKYRIEPTYLVTGDRKREFDIGLYLANCSREERDRCIDRVFAYMRRLMEQ